MLNCLKKRSSTGNQTGLVLDTYLLHVCRCHHCHKITISNNLTRQVKTPALSKGIPYGETSLFHWWDHRRKYQHAGGVRIHGGGIGWSGKRIVSAGKRGETGLFQRSKFLKEPLLEEDIPPALLTELPTATFCLTLPQ